MTAAPTPYCGAPPDPSSLWRHWNLDPVLISILALLAIGYALGADRARIEARRRAGFYAGWAIATLALVSPLCPLSVSLFSARVAQHIALELVAAPLVAIGAPWRAYRALAVPGKRPGRGQPHPLPAAGLFAAIIWYWHAPGPYDLTFEHAAIYWTMHVSAFGAALLLWNSLEQAFSRAAAAAIAASVASSVQMTFLGALITVAPHPLYAPHALTTAAWGLSQLDDQQIGGLIMWAPGCSIFLAAALLAFARVMKRADAADPAFA